MQERRLRLGDVLDDYCPREKRLTNHVIVALVENEVRQTRCTTCDTEHPFKHGRVPVRRKKPDATNVLYTQVLDNLAPKGRDASDAPDSVPRVPGLVVPAAVVPAEVAPPAEIARVAAPTPDASPTRDEPVHRHQLIRATLPKIEGQVPERKPADFTMWHVTRHAQARRGRGRDARGGADGNAAYSPFSNGHPKATGNTAGRQPHGQPARRNRRGGR